MHYVCGYSCCKQINAKILFLKLFMEFTPSKITANMALKLAAGVSVKYIIIIRNFYLPSVQLRYCIARNVGKGKH